MRALVHEQYFPSKAVIMSVLNKFAFKIEECDDIKNKEFDYYDIVFIGINDTREDKIKPHFPKLSKMAKVIIAVLHSDTDILRKEYFEHGAHILIPAHALEIDLEYKIKAIMSRLATMNFKNIKIINAIAQYSETLKYAFKMESLFHLLSKTYAFNGENYEKIKNILRFLSISFKEDDLNKLSVFWEQLDISQNMKIFFRSNAKPEVILVQAIVNYTRTMHGLQPLFIIDKHFQIQYDVTLNNVISADKNNIYLVITKGDFYRLKEVVIEHVGQNTHMMNELPAIVMECVLHNILYHDGSLVYFETNQIRIEPIENIIMGRCLNLIKKAIHSESVYELPVVYRGKRIGIDIELTSSITAKAIENEIKASSTINTISAVEFLLQHEVSSDDIQYLADLEEWIIEIMEGMHARSFNINKFVEINNLLYKYASNIVYYHELSDLANSIMELSKKMQELSTQQITSEWKAISYILETFIINIQKWRRSVFVDKNIDNINYLDASLKADLEQIYNFFAVESDSTNIEFF